MEAPERFRSSVSISQTGLCWNQDYSLGSRINCSLIWVLSKALRTLCKGLNPCTRTPTHFVFLNPTVFPTCTLTMSQTCCPFATLVSFFTLSMIQVSSVIIFFHTYSVFSHGNLKWPTLREFPLWPWSCRSLTCAVSRAWWPSLLCDGRAQASSFLVFCHLQSALSFCCAVTAMYMLLNQSSTFHWRECTSFILDEVKHSSKQHGCAGEHLGRNNGDISLACSGQEMKWFIPSNGPFCILEAEI